MASSRSSILRCMTSQFTAQIRRNRRLLSSASPSALHEASSPSPSASDAVHITENCVRKMKERQASVESSNEKMLRLSVETGGCSGSQYVFDLDDKAKPDDRLGRKLESQGLKMQCSDSSSELERFRVRRLELFDKNKGFIELLQQLTVCDSVSDKEFEERFRELSSLGDDHLIGVIEDQSGKIVATGSVFIEKKFIRNCGKVGHIEDVVVDASARGMQLGKKIVEFLSDHARSVGCYKVILDCSIENRSFYEKCGFKQKEIQMVKYLI